MIELSEIQEFVKDKNVLLVGNSDSVVQQDNSKLIDSYDIVVRMNHGTPRPNIGAKTDIWICFYSAVKQRQLPEHKLLNPRYMIVGYADNNAMDELKHKTLDLKMEWIKEIQDYMAPKNPSTGLAILFFFLNHTSPKSITLIGYDHFKTKSFYNQARVSGRWHDGQKEKEYIENLAKDGKVKLI